MSGQSYLWIDIIQLLDYVVLKAHSQEDDMTALPDKPSHTPWTLNQHKRSWNAARIDDANGVRVCTMSRNADRAMGEKKEFARLIAQAWTIPALRAALEAVDEYLSVPRAGGIRDEAIKNIHCQVCAALALAQQEAE